MPLDTPPPAAGKPGNGLVQLTRKDFQTQNDVRWCPGCGDYAILATLQRFLPTLGVPKENTVFISGIGCAARFPYYMETYGMHSIHGRAPTVATGLKLANPELDIWLVTGDGDALSIGGNHMLHLLRRNVNINVLLFNNRIYGLTKGQYSPASEQGKVTKSTPLGSLDHPVNPAGFALGADSTFYCRTVDRDAKHMMKMLEQAHAHQGTSFIEIFQNCIVFNDAAFDHVADKKQKVHNALYLEHGAPWVYDEGKKGIGIEAKTLAPYVIDLEKDAALISDVVVHDETDPSGMLSQVLAHLSFPEFPVPLGVFRRHERATYDSQVERQGEVALEKRGAPSLEKLLASGDVWQVD